MNASKGNMHFLKMGNVLRKVTKATTILLTALLGTALVGSPPASAQTTSAQPTWEVAANWGSAGSCLPFVRNALANQVRHQLGANAASIFLAHCAHKSRLNACGTGANGLTCRASEDIAYSFQKCIHEELLAKTSESGKEAGETCMESAIPDSGQLPPVAPPLETMKSSCKKMFKNSDPNQENCVNFVTGYSQSQAVPVAPATPAIQNPGTTVPTGNPAPTASPQPAPGPAATPVSTPPN